MCRTANGWDINGLGQQKDGRGNICPVTIILPTLAKMSYDDAIYAVGHVSDQQELDEAAVALFMDLLDKKIHEAKDMLIERFE